MSDTIKTPVKVKFRDAGHDHYWYAVFSADGERITEDFGDPKKAEQIARALNSEATLRGLLEECESEMLDAIRFHTPPELPSGCYDLIGCGCEFGRMHRLATRVRAALAEESSERKDVSNADDSREDEVQEG